jgi:hypothetical protein
MGGSHPIGWAQLLMIWEPIFETIGLTNVERNPAIHCLATDDIKARNVIPVGVAIINIERDCLAVTQRPVNFDFHKYLTSTTVA